MSCGSREVGESSAASVGDLNEAGITKMKASPQLNHGVCFCMPTRPMKGTYPTVSHIRLHVFLNVVLKVWLNCSVNPSHCGCYAVVSQFLMPHKHHASNLTIN